MKNFEGKTAVVTGAASGIGFGLAEKFAQEKMQVNLKYQKDYLITLNGSFPVDIMLERVTDNSSNTKLSNVTRWDSYTEIIDAKFCYPKKSPFNKLPQNASQILQNM